MSIFEQQSKNVLRPQTYHISHICKSSNIFLILATIWTFWCQSVPVWNGLYLRLQARFVMGLITRAGSEADTLYTFYQLAAPLRNRKLPECHVQCSHSTFVVFALIKRRSVGRFFYHQQYASFKLQDEICPHECIESGKQNKNGKWFVIFTIQSSMVNWSVGMH